MSVLELVGGLVLLLLIATFKALAVSELTGRVPAVCEALIELAVRRLPEDSRERYREEWLADLGQLEATPLTALKHALLVGARAGSMCAQLADRGVGQGGETRRRGLLLFLDDDYVLAGVRSRGSRVGPLVEWQEVVGAMRAGAALEQTEERLEQANVRFAELLAPAQPSSVHELQSLRERRVSEPAREARGRPGSASVEYEPGKDPFWHRPRRHVPQARRFGPRGAADPEWRIAALTRRERRVAETYRRDALEGLLLDWPSGAVGALLSAIDRYEDRATRGRDPLGDEHAIRLSVFLAAWSNPEADLAA